MDVGNPRLPGPVAGAVLPADLPARFERLPFTRYQRGLFFVVATAFFFDCLDVAILTFVLAPISTDLTLNSGQAGLVASATFAGMGIGASLAGVLSDRFGRKPVFGYSILLWGVASLGMAFSWDFTSLLVFRLLTGIGLGAELPVAQALLTEFLPAGRRGKYMGLMQGGFPVALLSGGGLSLLLVPGLGWRSVFVVMAALALVGFFLRRHVPESPRWCASRGLHGRAEAAMTDIEQRVERASGQPLPPVRSMDVPPPDQATRNPMRELLAGAYRRRTMMAWGLWFCLQLGYYAITAWIAKLLVDNGMSVSGSIAFVMLMQVWGVPGFLLAAHLLERVGRKPVVATTILLSAGAAYLYGSATSTVAVVVTGSILQFCLMAMWAGVYTYTPELFSTRARATGSGTASAVGRIGALLGPSLVPPVLLAWGYTATFAAIAGLLLIAALLVITMGPETRGRTLEEVSS